MSDETFVLYLFCCAVPDCDNMTHFQQVGYDAATHQPQTKESYPENKREEKLVKRECGKDVCKK